MRIIKLALLLSLAVLLSASLLFSQSGRPNKPPEFDHTTVHVRDLQRSAEFYEKVMEFEKISDPFKDAQHVWFRIGLHEQLHVVGGATDVPKQGIHVHFAFRVASVPDFTTHLDQMHVKYVSIQGQEKVITLRADGVKQIYFQDPDGYWIEVNDDKF